MTFDLKLHFQTTLPSPAILTGDIFSVTRTVVCRVKSPMGTYTEKPHTNHRIIKVGVGIYTGMGAYSGEYSTRVTVLFTQN